MTDFNGPWVVSPTNDLQVDDSESRAVAWTETCVGIEKDRANARLIAAAPDLLAVVKELAGTPWGKINIKAMQGKAEAAIRKALGEPQ